MIRFGKCRYFKETIMILLGAFLMALAINLVFEPMGIVTGGVTGLAIIIKSVVFKVSGKTVDIWVLNLLFNVPLFLVAFFVKGKKYIIKTLIGTLALTLALYVIPEVGIFEDVIIAVIFGAILNGVGIGLVLAASSTTGGTDLFCALLHEKMKYISIPVFLFVVDGLIVAGGAAEFGIDKAMYAVVEVYICSKISDTLLEGLKFAKMAQIISDKTEEIADMIMKTIDRGATEVEAKGMYSGDKKKMLYCAVAKKQIVELTDIVYSIDPKAFIVIYDVREVRGEGFMEYHPEERK